MDKLYSKIGWENQPSTKSPLSAENLNKMDKGIDDLDNRLIETSSELKEDLSEISSYDDNTEIINRNCVHYENRIVVTGKSGERYKNAQIDYTDLEVGKYYTFSIESVQGAIDSICVIIEFYKNNDVLISGNTYLYTNGIHEVRIDVPNDTVKTSIKFYLAFTSYLSKDSMAVFRGFKIYKGIESTELQDTINLNHHDIIVENDMVAGSINNSGTKVSWDNTTSMPRLITDFFFTATKIQILNLIPSSYVYVNYYRNESQDSFVSNRQYSRNTNVVEIENPDGYYIRLCIITTSASYTGNPSVLYDGIYIRLFDYERNIFGEEIEKTITSVQNAIVGDCVVLPWLSDTHDNPNDNDAHETSESTLMNLERLCNKLPIDGILHTGDYVAKSYYSTSGNSNAKVFSCVSNYINRLASFGKSVFAVVGNHDGKEANNSDADVWVNNCNGKISLNYKNVVGGVKSNYFYTDFPIAKTRLICLAIPDDNYWGAGGEQLNWLANIALNTPDGYSVMVAYHMPYIMTSGLYNSGALVDCLNAYHNHTSGSTGMHSGGSLHYDFTRYVNTKLVCVFVGHIHGDFVLNGGQTSQNGQTNRYVCPIVGIGAGAWITTAWTEGVPEAVMPNRTRNTISENLFDIIVYSETSKTLKLIRFGAGEDRTINLSHFA